MKRFGIAFFVMLAFTVTSAQTRWEYVSFEMAEFGSGGNPETAYSLLGNNRFSNATNLEEFSRQLESDTPIETYWDVINHLGREGFEMVSHNLEMSLSPQGTQQEIQVWFFKRPVP